MALTPEHIEDIYPLSATQQGMLFHGLLAPRSGVYIVQVGFTLTGNLDDDAFNTAWAELQRRHTLLRTAIAWEGLKQPMQVVGRRAELPLYALDWRELDADSQADELASWLAGDRQQGFDTRQAPLFRVTRIRLADDEVRVIWTYHHLLMDGWSLPLLLREWIASYLASTRGERAALPAPRAYKDFIQWLDAQDKQRVDAFWRGQLAGFCEPNPLTPGTQAKDVNAPHAASSITVDRHASDELMAFARRERLTPGTLVLGAWALLLHQLSGASDIVFGLARSGRPTDFEDFESRVGLFLNLLPMRVPIDHRMTVSAWLTELQARQLAQQPYEQASLRELHDNSEVPATRSLFESIVVFENYPSTDEAVPPGSPVRVTDIDVTEQTNYPLSLYATADEQIELRLLYDAGLFDAAAVAGLLSQLTLILNGLCKPAADTLAQLPTISADAWHRHHVEPNRSGRRTAAPLVNDAFAQQAGRYAAHTALIHADQTLSFAAVDRQANRLANFMLNQGIKAGQVVGICLERDASLPIAILAILRCGCAYVPLDPHYPGLRLAQIIEDADMAALVVHSASLASLPASCPPLIDLDAASDRITRSSDRAPAVAPSPSDLAYRIYTSGSTGTPKGVDITHANLANLLEAMRERVDFDHDSRLLAVTTLAFDIATLEMLMPIYCGGTLVIAGRDDARNADRLQSLLAQHDITVLQATPTTWRMLLDSGWGGQSNLCALCGGEALAIDLAGELAARTGTLWNVYGPTETTIWSAALRLTPALLDGETVPIGQPLANTVLHVIDAQGRPLPAGFVGELAIGGAGVSPGYHGNSELTGQRFVASQLPAQADLPAAPMLYRTGDRVRQRFDGLYEFLGRLDQQTKLRGFRIEPGDIEATLQQHPAVQRAVAEVADAGTAKARLVAVFVRRAEAEDTGSQLLRSLQQHCAQWLPTHMVPTAFAEVAELPTLPNGKLDRASIRQLATPVAGSGGAPRTPTERILAELWQSLLGSDAVGPDDNFFEIGGHSLLIVRAQGQIKQRLGVEIALVDLFRFPTPTTLAEHIDALGSADADVETGAADQRRSAGRARVAAQRGRRRASSGAGG